MWTAIAEWIAKTNSDAKVRVIDTDLGWDAMRPSDGHLDEIVVPYPIYEWDDYRPAIHAIRAESRTQDWLVYDLVDVIWDQAQEAYFSKRFGRDIDEFYLAEHIRADQTNTGASVGGDYGINWQLIKKLYQQVIDPIPRFRGHVLACATADKVSAPDPGKRATVFHDAPEIVEKYGRIGWKPNGQKKLAHMFHSELFMAETPGGYRVTTVKERGPVGEVRSRLEGKVVNPDFVVVYLMGVAGWRP